MVIIELRSRHTLLVVHVGQPLGVGARVHQNHNHNGKHDVHHALVAIVQPGKENRHKGVHRWHQRIQRSGKVENSHRHIKE